MDDGAPADAPWKILPASDLLSRSNEYCFAEFGPVAKLSRWGIDLHMGSMFGLANQLVLFAVAIGIAAAAVGVFLPLLGISLAAFLVAEVVLGAVARRRAAAHTSRADRTVSESSRRSSGTPTFKRRRAGR